MKIAPRRSVAVLLPVCVALSCSGQLFSIDGADAAAPAPGLDATLPAGPDGAVPPDASEAFDAGSSDAAPAPDDAGPADAGAPDAAARPDASAGDAAVTPGASTSIAVTPLAATVALGGTLRADALLQYTQPAGGTFPMWFAPAWWYVIAPDSTRSAVTPVTTGTGASEGGHFLIESAAAQVGTYTVVAGHDGGTVDGVSYPGCQGSAQIAVLAEAPDAGAGSGITAVGKVFYDGPTAIASGYGPQLRGLNEATALVWLMSSASSDWGTNMNFYNPGGNSRIGNVSIDATDPDSIANYFYAYGQLLQSYGLNLLRMGGHDAWGLDNLYRAWRADPAQFASRARAAIRGLRCAGVYTIVQLGGMASGAGESQLGTLSQSSYTRPMTGSDCIFNAGSASFAYFVEYSGDVARRLAGTPGLVAVELLNEPEMWADMRDWWGPFDDPDAAAPYYFCQTDGGAAAAYEAWADALLAAVKTSAGASRPLLTIGASSAGWSCDAIGSGDFSAYQVSNRPAGLEVAQVHLYYPCGGYDQQAGYGWSYYTDGIRDAVDLPLVISEWGERNQVWSSTVDGALNGSAVSNAAMTLYGAPGYPPAQRSFTALPASCR